MSIKRNIPEDKGRDTRNRDSKGIAKEAAMLARRLDTLLSGGMKASDYDPNKDGNPAQIARKLYDLTRRIRDIWHPKDGK